MRACILFGLLILGAAGIVGITPNLTQGQGKKNGGFGGGFPGGGGAAAMMSREPGEVFDMYSKGRGFFLISETRTLQGALIQYAQEKGISNGQINRVQYLDFHSQYKAKVESGGAGGNPFAAGGNPFGPGGAGGNPFGKGKNKGMGLDGMGGPGMMTPAGPAPSADAINAAADALFKRFDKNEDGKLNQDEMPKELRASLTRFDKNNDGLIDINEFRDYYVARMSGDTDPTIGRSANQIVIDEDELDRRVVVLRAGKLPSNMPDWFKEYDLDGDGQVSLAEWRKVGKKLLGEFEEWDLNDDSFITPEEALKHQSLLAKDNPKAGRGPGSMAAMGPGASFDPTSGKMVKGMGKGKGNQGGDPGAAPAWPNMGKGKNKKGGGKDTAPQE